MKRLLLMLFGIGLVIAGCSEGDASDSNAVITVEDPEAVNPADLVLAAVEQTGSLTSFRADYITNITGLLFVGEYVQPASIMQAANGDNSITIDLADATLDSGGLPFELLDSVAEMRQLGDTIYISLPEELTARFADTEWISITRDQVAVGDLEYFESFDPEKQLNLLLGVDENAVVSQGEEVDGVVATRISGESTVEQVLAALDPEERQEMLDLIGLAFSSQVVGIEEAVSSINEIILEFDVWINEEGYILQEIVVFTNLSQALEAIAPTLSGWIEAIGNLKLTFETHFFDHGAPITIAEPPPEDVTPYEGSVDSLLSLRDAV